MNEFIHFEIVLLGILIKQNYSVGIRLIISFLVYRRENDRNVLCAKAAADSMRVPQCAAER